MTEIKVTENTCVECGEALTLEQIKNCEICNPKQDYA